MPNPLFDAIRAGDEDAWTRFTVQVLPKLLYWAQAYGGDWQDAQDIAQNVLLDVWRRLRDGKLNDVTDAWLQRRTEFERSNFFRKKRGRSKKRKYEVSGLETLPEETDDQTTSHQTLEQAEEAELVRDKLCALPTEFTPEIVRDRFYRGMTLGDIAEKRKMTVARAKGVLNRALRQLRRELQPYFDRDNAPSQDR